MLKIIAISFLFLAVACDAGTPKGVDASVAAATVAEASTPVAVVEASVVSVVDAGAVVSLVTDSGKVDASH